MAEHHPHNVVGFLKWCNQCKRQTMHAVSGGKVGHCEEHTASGMSKKQEAAAKKRAEEAEQAEMNPKLF